MGKLRQSTEKIQELLDKVEQGGGSSYDDTELREEIAVRNVSAVDTGESADDVVAYATTMYVDNAITAAIIETLNTPV